MGCSGSAADPQAAPQGAGESELRTCSNASSTSLSTDRGVCRALALTFSLVSPGCCFTASSFPFLTPLSQRGCHHSSWAQPWPAVGSAWRCLALALLDMGAASHRNHPLAPTAKTLPHKPSATIF